MIYQIKSYLSFLIHSTNKHGIHSPFVYSLTTLCFNDLNNYSEYQLFKKHRLALLNDEREIEIQDFGAGSRVFKGNRRKISMITRVAGLTRKRQRLLFRLAKYLKVKESLELGTSVGLGTAALASGSGKVTTVEGCSETLKVAKDYLNKFGFRNIVAHSDTFENFFKDLNPNIKFDLIYIDGDHSGKNTFTYFEKILKHVHNDSVLIFDDIYWSPQMTAAWNRICKHPEVSVSIDTFQWGIVFFRKEQRKQHFIIRV